MDSYRNILEKLLVELTNDINKAKSIADLIKYEQKYIYFNNPYKHYLLGNSYINNNDYSKAYKHFIQAAEMGLDNPGKYLNSIFADSVGSSLFNISRFNLEKYLISPNLLYNMYINAYYFLSSSINFLKDTAYESYMNRGSLLSLKQDETKSFLFSYLGIFSIPEVLILSDFYFSSVGYAKYGFLDKSNKYLKKADNVHKCLEDINITGRAANTYSIEELANIGRDRHSIIFHNLNEDFKINKFKIDFELLKNIQI